MNTKLGKYIYCIIKSNVSESFGNTGIGEDTPEVSAIALKDIAAVVSNSPIIDYRVSRNNMMAHEKTIENVMKKIYSLTC